MEKYDVTYTGKGAYSAEYHARLFAASLRAKGFDAAVSEKCRSDARAIVFDRSGEFGKWSVKVSENGGVLVTAGSYFAFEAALSHLDGGISPASGVCETPYYTGTRGGEYRVMFSNILGIRKSDAATAKLRTAMSAEAALAYAPDIVALQECCPVSRGDLGYDGIMKRAGYAESDVPFSNDANNNYTPIFYRADRFAELGSDYAIYPETNNTKSYSRTVFEDRRNGKRFAVIGTHFRYIGGGSNETHLGSVDILAGAAKETREKFGCPVIAGGDLNSTKETEEYAKLLSLGFADAHGLARDADDVATEHGYPVYDPDAGVYNAGRAPEPGYAGAIDHAFVFGGGVSVGTYHTVTDTYVLRGTDHCPILVDFDIEGK